MKHILISFGFLLSVTTHSTAQSFDQSTILQLQNDLDSLLTAQQIKGVTAAVTMPSGDLWKGVSGISHTGVPILPEMLFGIGSNTKLFTAVSILKLYDAGVLQLDDSIYHWIPAHPNIDSCITIRQLLNHTSGLTDYNQIQGYNDTILSNPNRIFTKQELLSWIGTPQFAPGTGWSYSSTNYLLAGMIVEQASSQLLGPFLHQELFSPLQLDSTFLAVEDSLIGTIAHPWVNGIDIGYSVRTSTNSAAWAAGAIYSTAAEMAQWYHTLFSGTVLSTAAFNEMTTPVGSGSYGMGMSRQVLNGRVVWGHTGNIRGYQSCFIHDVITGINVAVIVNEVPSAPLQIAARLLATSIGGLLATVDHPVHPDWTATVIPNPVNRQIEIRSALFTGNDSWQIEWRDVNGKMLHVESATTTAQSLLLTTNLPSGMYLIHLRSETNPEKESVLKIYKE